MHLCLFHQVVYFGVLCLHISIVVVVVVVFDYLGILNQMMIHLSVRVYSVCRLYAYDLEMLAEVDVLGLGCSRFNAHGHWFCFNLWPLLKFFFLNDLDVSLLLHCQVLDIIRFTFYKLMLSDVMHRLISIFFLVVLLFHLLCIIEFFELFKWQHSLWTAINFYKLLVVCVSIWLLDRLNIYLVRNLH